MGCIKQLTINGKFIDLSQHETTGSVDSCFENESSGYKFGPHSYMELASIDDTKIDSVSFSFQSTNMTHGTVFSVNGGRKKLEPLIIIDDQHDGIIKVKTYYSMSSQIHT